MMIEQQAVAVVHWSSNSHQTTYQADCLTYMHEVARDLVNAHWLLHWLLLTGIRASATSIVITGQYDHCQLRPPNGTYQRGSMH